ncbi:MAG: HD-GYP domain protein [Comamonadaceae bacterium]|nr:MAG: HD-GYP domain protein [Comamonadaceae bacterium]
MLTYVPVPLSRVQLGRALPVDIRNPDGRLLLRRGQVLQSEAHRDMLSSHQACMTETDAQAWQRALDRQMRNMRLKGMDMNVIAQLPMPEEILDTDYLEGSAVEGSWLDLQEILRGLLYQGAQASTPLPRLQGLEQKALKLLSADTEECLFVLFQALPDLELGYCATHALLSGVVSALTAAKLALPMSSRMLLLRSALVMNIGMARPQDYLARQLKAPSPAQRELISAHPPNSVDILRGFGVQDDEWLNAVHWHHAPNEAKDHTGQIEVVQLLHLADTLVAKMAPRLSRPAMSAFGAAKSLVLEANAQTQQQRVAMASVLGFYPPGTYAQLVNGEVAVVVARGEKATTPHVASLINAKGMPMSAYVYRDTRHADHGVRMPLAASQVNVRVNLERIRRLRQQHGV